MEFAGIFRTLWSRRTLVVVGLLAALCAGAFVATRAPAADIAFARAQMLVDTPRSLSSAIRPDGYDTIATRAALLGSLIATDELRAEVAGRAGVRPADLGIVDLYLGAPASETPLSRQAVEVSKPKEPQLLTVAVENPQVPIVSVLAQAETGIEAARLATAATATLESLVAGSTAGERGVEIQQLGGVTTWRVAEGGKWAKAALAWAVGFALWCAAVLALEAIARRGPSRSAASADGLRAV